MPDEPLTTADDFFHERPADEPHWNESGWFGFNIPERNIAGYVYTHHRPNQGFAWCGTGLWDDKADRMDNCLWNDFTARPIPAQMRTPLESPVFGYKTDHGLELEQTKTFEQYKFRYHVDGYDLDLQWDAFMPPHNSGLPKEWADWGTGHYEQGGRMTGELTIEGEKLEVDCYSGRDRSWGPHRPHRIHRGDFMWAIASPDHCFLAQAVNELPSWDDPVIGTTEVVKRGWYKKDGKIGALVDGERRVVERGPDSRPLRIEATARDDLGREIEITGVCRNWLAYTFSQSFWWWCLTEWTFDGVTAWGEEQDAYVGSHYRRFARSLRS